MGAVEEMMCVVCVSFTEGHSGDGCDLASTLCKYMICSELDKGATTEAGKYVFRAANVRWMCAQYFDNDNDSANQRFKYTKYKNHYLIQKQYPLYVLLVSARLIKYIVKTKHMSIKTSKSKAYCKLQIANNKLLKNHLNCLEYIIRYKETCKKEK